MVDALKKLDRKFLIFVGCIILLPIVLIIFLVIIQGCGNSKMTYKNYEQKMISAATKYIKGNEPTDEGDFITVSLDTLVERKYIKSASKALNDDACTGNVTVRRNGASVESNNGGFLNYTVTLNCKEYSTKHLKDVITENAIASDELNGESGLYKYGDFYVFKGDKVNNYIKLYGINYRIMSIDENGLIKIISAEPQSISRVWDNKFNAEVNYSYGKSIFNGSSIQTYLITNYENKRNVSQKARQHIVAINACVGKKSKENYTISRELDCSSTLEKQVITLINVSDFALASADPDCNDTKSKSCRNYNYLYAVAPSTWTMNSVLENTYEVFLITEGTQQYQNANTYNEYNFVIYIDGNELYTGGIGSKADPYVLK